MLRRFIGALTFVALLTPVSMIAQAQKPAPAKPAATKPAATAAKPAAETASGPQLVIETVKGTIVVQLFPQDAPKAVDHVLKLARRGFYTNQRVHRVVKGQFIQFGDVQSRDATLREWWGRGPNSGSGQPIGVAEISKTRKHKPGTVAMADSGDPAAADSQMYITTRAMPNLDGHHTIIGQVVTGLDVVPKIAMGDVIKKVTVKEASGT
jgi:cyclophilin family peptidyl-prolyl cis-trans isomerase